MWRRVLAEARWGLDTDRRGTVRFLVYAHVCAEPPDFALPVDFALTDEEACVEPAVRVSFGRQFNAGCDSTPTPGCILVDALPVDSDEDVFAVSSSNEATQVWRPHAIIPATRIVGPYHESLDVAGHLSLAMAEAERLPAALG